MKTTVLTGLMLAILFLRDGASANKEPFFLMTASLPNSPAGGGIVRMEPGTYDIKGLEFAASGFSDRLHRPMTVDFDPETDEIYWSETGVSRIRRASLSGGEVQTVYVGKTGSFIEGLAVDPKARLIFFTDRVTDIIGKLTIPSFHMEVIIISGLDSPRAIVLDIDDQVMFWTDYGQLPKIERCNYDGTERRTIVSTGIKIVNGLALDAPRGRLYWVDGYLNQVKMSNLEGFGQKIILGTGPTSFLYGVALYQGSLYITDWEEFGARTNSSILYRVELDGTDKIIKTATDLRLNDIHAYSGGPHLSERGAGWSVAVASAVLFIVIAG